MKTVIYTLIIASILSSCTVSTTDDFKKEEEDTIKDQIAQGMIAEGVSFKFVSGLSQKGSLFSKDGYTIHLSEKSTSCDNYYNDMASSSITPISFFIDTNTTEDLKVGDYKGKGPFIHYDGTSTSFLGCTVKITKVTPTTIEGKVKGGDESQSMYIEGSFSVPICTIVDKK